SLPFLYGGDMVAEGRGTPEAGAYNGLPWKYAAGTPNLLGVLVSAQALRLLVDLVAGEARYFDSERPLSRADIESTCRQVCEHKRGLTAAALRGLADLDGVTLYGPPDAAHRVPLMAF